MTEEQIAERFAHDNEQLKEHERRIAELETEQKEISSLTQSVQKLAITMENMVAEQKKQGERLDTLEREPAENAKYYRRTAISCIVTAIISAIVGALIGLII